jgi:hypothetical protein
MTEQTESCLVTFVYPGASGSQPRSKRIVLYAGMDSDEVSGLVCAQSRS